MLSVKLLLKKAHMLCVQLLLKKSRLLDVKLSHIKTPPPMLTLYDPGGGALKAPPLRFFALTHLILELHYCALVTFPKK